jgi:hypothetical protein
MFCIPISNYSLFSQDFDSNANWADEVPELYFYHRILDAASIQGLTVFVGLTHFDKYLELLRYRRKNECLPGIARESDEDVHWEQLKSNRADDEAFNASIMNTNTATSATNTTSANSSGISTELATADTESGNTRIALDPSIFTPGGGADYIEGETMGSSTTNTHVGTGTEVGIDGTDKGRLGESVMHLVKGIYLQISQRLVIYMYIYIYIYIYMHSRPDSQHLYM